MPKHHVGRFYRLGILRRKSVRRIGLGFVFLAVVLLYGVTGYVLLGWKPFDALYMVVITLSTVGYGEVHPIVEPALRIHTMMLITLGTLAVGFMVASVIGFFTEGEIAQVLGHQRMRRQIEELKDHVIVTGFGRMGSLLCTELTAVGLPFVVIERKPERIPELDRLGCLRVLGDATEELVLEEAGLHRARALVTTIPDDATSVFITLTVRQLAPRLTIFARAELPSTQRKLKQAGANHVVVPASIGAHRVATLLTNPTAVEFTELVTQRTRLAIEMDEVLIDATAPLSGITLRDADIGRRTGVMVIAIKRADGRLEFPPRGDEPFAPEDSIVLLGHREHLERFRQAFCGLAHPPEGEPVA